MPAIPQEVLDTVVYLYPDADCAARGEKAGGSGCLVIIPTQLEPFSMGFMYIVTNSHVIREGKASALRVNTRDGKLGIVHSTTEGWIHHPYGDDVAVLPISLEYDIVKARGIPLDWLITKEKIQHYNIGPGDETFIIGRFVNHEGKQQNLPTVRFGQLSMLPLEPIRTGRGLLQEVFLVESRSLPGYSGSPVFISPMPFSAVRREHPPAMLLGIDMGHITDQGRVLSRGKTLAQNKCVAVDEDWFVETNTGMSLIVPAWKIHETLFVEELVESRKEALKELEKHKASSPAPSTQQS